MKEEKSPGVRQPVAELDLLKPFVGEWTIEGVNYAPDGEGNAVRGMMTNQWLAGGFFVKTDWSYESAVGDHIGSGFIGFQEESHSFYIRNADNMGYDKKYEIHIEGNVWTFTGESEKAGFTFNEDGSGYHEQWQVKIGGEWRPLCDRTGRRNG